MNRAGLEAWLLNAWYAQARPRWWLIPVSWLFAALTAVRRGAYQLGLLPRVTLPVPVIVIGNITVGGSGKTPLVIHLVETLRAMGKKPGVILRGYGGGVTAPQLVQPDSDAAQAGDEAVLLARRAGCPVATGRDRVAAARLLLEQNNVDVIVSDDGLQHYRLNRALEIAVLDGTRLLGNGGLLPAGPLREPAARLDRVDAVVINGQISNGEPGAWPGALCMMLTPHTVYAVAQPAQTRVLADFAGQQVHALAGIGNPQRFFDLLHAHGITVIPHPLPDHAELQSADISFADDLPILMTEKDAVKCHAFATPRHWAVAVQATFSSTGQAQLENLLREKLP